MSAQRERSPGAAPTMPEPRRGGRTTSTTNWWTVTDTKGVPLYQTVGLHLGKRAACSAAAQQAGASWKALHAAGCRAIRLRITRVPDHA